MGAHIREFRKVTAAASCSREPCVGLAGRSWQPRGGRSVAERLDAALGGALLQRAVVRSVAGRSTVLCRKGRGSDTKPKTMLCKGDILPPRKPPTLPGALQRTQQRCMSISIQMSTCSLRKREPSLLGWVNVHLCWSITENGSFCFYGSFLECGNIFD